MQRRSKAEGLSPRATTLQPQPAIRLKGSHGYRPSSTLAARPGTERGEHHAAPDVPLLVPGDDRLQHPQTARLGDVHRCARRREPADHGPGGRSPDRRDHAGLHDRDRPAPAALGDPSDPDRHRRPADRVLGALQQRGGVLVGDWRVSVPAYPRCAADQPVLDPGQRCLRPAAGETLLRVHRRRGRAGWADRLLPGPADGRSCRVQQPAPGECRAARWLHAHRDRGANPIEGYRAPGHRLGGRGEGRRVEPGPAHAARVESPQGHCDRHRASRDGRLPDRAATEYGRGGVRRCR